MDLETYRIVCGKCHLYCICLCRGNGVGGIGFRGPMCLGQGLWVARVWKPLEFCGTSALSFLYLYVEGRRFQDSDVLGSKFVGCVPGNL